jgi:hypothetical protein
MNPAYIVQCSLHPLLDILQWACTAWVEPLNTRDDGRGKAYRSWQKHDSLSPHDYFFFVYNKPKVKGIHSSNYVDLYRIKLCYLTRTNDDCSSANLIFTWNTWVTVHKQGTVSFP